MKKTIFTTVSAVALLAALPAFSDTASTNTSTRAEAEANTEELKADVQAGWEKTKETVSEAADDVSKATQDAYQDIKAAVVDENAPKGDGFKQVTIDPRITADGIIGKPVHNSNGESIAKVHDIIIDQEGKANMVILADGEIIGMGKKVAFDYNAIARVNADGDVIMPITEDSIKKADEFTYDRKADADKMRVIPEGSYSVSKLLDGQLVDQNKKTVGDIDNIVFKNGYASQLIIGFDKILGLGGEKAALRFDSAPMIADGESYDFQLSAQQSAQFEGFKKTITN